MLLQTQNMTDFADQLLDLAQKAGADCAEVYQSYSHARPLFFEANRLKQIESSESEGTALRLWRNGCPGLAVAYGEVEAATLVERALALSHLNAPETPELAPQMPEKVFPRLGQAQSVESLMAAGNEAIAQLRHVHPEILAQCELSCTENTTRLVNTNGLRYEYSEIGLSGYLGVEWVRDEDFLGIYESQESRDRLDMTSLTENIINRLAWAAENTPSPQGRVPILFANKAAHLLWDVVVAAMNARAVVDRASPWSDARGQQVASACLSLRQEAHQGPYSCPFDDEGTLTQSFDLIRQGGLAQFYSDRATSRRLGTHSTGNGFRPSLGSYPSPDLINLSVDPGQGSLLDLARQLDNGLILDQILGGGADISGDFSINVDLGYRVKNGEIVGRVKDTMVTGNAYKALLSVTAVGSDRVWSGAYYTPSLIVDGLSVVSSIA
jgi:PmbA protein